MKFVYIVVGVFIGWLTVGMLLAGPGYDWRYERIVTLLEKIESNTR